MDKASLIDRFVQAVGQGDLDAALDLFHEESWDTANRVYGKKAIRRYLQEFLQSLAPESEVCLGRLVDHSVAYIQMPGRLGSIARRGYWWIEVKDGLIGELNWEGDHVRASLVVPERL